MSQQRKSSLALVREADEPRRAVNAIDEAHILDAAYDLLLSVGLRRMTIADIARRADVSRATLYRRWPNVDSIVADLMTREWAALGESVFSASPGSTGRSRLVAGTVAAVRAVRDHPMLRKIVDVDPEFLVPYLLERQGTSTRTQLDALSAGIIAGQLDGSVRLGDASLLASAYWLTACSFTLTGPVLAEDRLDSLDSELALLLDRYLAP